MRLEFKTLFRDGKYSFGMVNVEVNNKFPSHKTRYKKPSFASHKRKFCPVQGLLSSQLKGFRDPGSLTELKIEQSRDILRNFQFYKNMISEALPSRLKEFGLIVEICSVGL